MMDSLYQFTNKGSLRTLSLILAVVLTGCFFFNINEFATQLRTVNPLIVLLIVWSNGILWIHGIGFTFRFLLWQILFHPVIGWIVGTISLIWGLLM
ncbi:cyd operon protein YbgE [Conservatibacter flavescens]|uniref:Cyd operon protein YbgE n=1 Tax=Conservatibacter flavescens TaxID=28161 RepID=A0A2M8S0E8_9PAST|nr:cyd operon protein YbgE [Conservatibacter flavescens]PJG84617.1 cyd operon protein YbgE [Conservatibacter flavescens]